MDETASGHGERNNRILVVDDQASIHDDFRDVLAAPKAETDALAAAFLPDEPAHAPAFELQHAASGEQACALVDEACAAGRPLAVAFVDIRMPPGMDGVATIRRIREIDADIELVVMTAYSDKTLGEITGSTAPPHKLLYVRKPFAREEIQQLAVALTEKRAAELSLRASRRELLDGQRRLRAILDASGEAIAMFDPAGRLAFANDTYEELCGANEAELAERPANAARPKLGTPSDALAALAGGGEGELLEHADEAGSRLLRRTESPVADADGETIGRLHVYRDVSKDVENRHMAAEVRQLRAELESSHARDDRFGGMVGASPAAHRLFALVARAAQDDVTVLIRGETGTGKELVARALHYNGPRKARPFRVVDCASLPENLIENELFGHERGAFTGADRRRIGTFEEADGGTVFLDEIGDMPAALQTKLLRVLQERQVQRLGGGAPVEVDVRILAATNRDLDEAMAEGTFRRDLYYRLAEFPILVPPLRERREDIPLLATHFLKLHAEKLESDVAAIDAEAVELLLRHDWPGNVRELESAINRAVLLETSDRLQAPSLLPLGPATAGLDASAAPSEPDLLPLKEMERRAVKRALQVSGGNVTRAARALGIDRATLHRKLKRLDGET